MGCVYAATGMPLKRVASAPAVGQYTLTTATVGGFTTAIYAFNTADGNNVVYINYQYVTSSGFIANSTAFNQTVQNLAMGYAPSFKADLTVSYLGKIITFSFAKAVATKMSLGLKNEDFSVPEFDFSAFDPGNGNVMQWSTSE